MANPFLAVILVAIVPMAVFGLFASGLVLNKIGWAPTPLWTDQFGTPGLNIKNGITAMSADKTGFYLGGYVGLPPSNLYNPNPSAVFLARYDSSRHQVWRQDIGTAYANASNWITSISPGSDGIYVAGALNGTGFVRKYDTNGTVVWTNYLASDEKGRSTAISAGSNSVFVVALESFTNQSSVIVLRSYSFSGNLVWRIPVRHGYQYNGSLYNPRLSYGDGAVYVSGCAQTVTRRPSVVINDTLFVSKLEDNATLRWTTQLGNNGCIWPTILADARGVYVFGDPSEISDGLLERLDLNGKLAWYQSVDASSNAMEQLAISKSSSAVFLSWGLDSGTLARYDENGQKSWSIAVKTGPSAVGTRMVLSALDDGVYVAGALHTYLYLDSGEFASIEQFTPSSSLVMFGIYSPYSFVLVSSLVGVGSLITIILVRYARQLNNNGIRGPPPKIVD